jgi:hypothetical protein
MSQPNLYILSNITEYPVYHIVAEFVKLENMDVDVWESSAAEFAKLENSSPLDASVVRRFLFDVLNIYIKESKKFVIPSTSSNIVVSCYASFRAARTWTDVLHAFSRIHFDDENAMALLILQEHFEDIITEAIKGHKYASVFKNNH